MAKKQFKAESKRLLDLMINSIYTHKEIFLREIISNASDAIDKLAYQALTDDKVGLNRSDFAIEIAVDKEHGVLTISDNGIGMTKEEMEQNLGTIAKSGSLAFKEEMEQKDDIDIIGQFGVGFYSAFMVADNVTVISRKYGEDGANMWQSSGADGYTITACEKDAPGTDIIMKLKADTEDEKYSEYLEQNKLMGLIKKYSDFVRYPIRMDVQREVPKEGSDPNKPEYETVTQHETLNSMVPLWQRSKKEITPEEYKAFYKNKYYDSEDPACYLHLDVEGAVSFKALLFVPRTAPFAYYSKDWKKGLQLYSSGVLIQDICEELLPDHFRFVRGIVDSQDLSLNISREMLQHDRQLRLIANNIEKKVRAELLKLMENDRPLYEKFYNAFGLQLKYGVTDQYGMNRDTLQDLLLFWSSKEEKLVSLKDYQEKMLGDQKYIYYASGDSRSRIAQLPQTELVRSHGFDVLYFTDEVEEFVVQILMQYGGFEFRNVVSADLGFDTGVDLAKEEEEAKPVLDFLKQALEGKISDAKLSGNLGSHPVSLASDTDITFEMEKYFNRMNPEHTYKAGRVLELNKSHAIFKTLEETIPQDAEKAKKYAELLYCQALLMADLPLEDPTAYTDLVVSLMN